MKIKKGILVSILSLTMVISFSGCEGEEEYQELSGQDAINTFASSSNLYFTGDLDDFNVPSDVIADGYICGTVKETGLFNPGIKYSVDGEDMFYMEYYTKSDMDGGYPASATYVYYDMDKNVLGYAQERAIFKNDYKSVLVFLDAEGNMKDHYIYPNSRDSFGWDWVTNGCNVCNMNGEKEGFLDLSITNKYSNKFAMNMDLGNAAEDLSEMDRVALYWRCLSELNEYNRQYNDD